MTPLSVLLPVYNEQDQIVDCLETVKWADEILLVDSFSSDSTIEIASAYNVRVVQHEYINSARQKNWAIPQCSYPWVLQLDADERLEPALQLEIQQILSSPPEGVDGFIIPFKHYILGEWVRVMGLYPEYHLRLFKRDTGRFQDREVDAHVVVSGHVETLCNHIHHYGVESISQRLRSLDRYTRYEADERIKQNRPFSVVQMIARTIGVFLHTYIGQRGFSAGMRGMILSFLKADFVFWTYAKMWEIKNRKK